MEWFIGLFDVITVWHWFALAALLVALEITMPSTWLLWPGLAAIVVGIIVSLAPALGWPLQVLIFSGIAVVMTVFGRGVMGEAGHTTGKQKLNRRADQYVGRRAVVAETFVAGRGAILIDGVRWIAVSVDGANLVTGTAVEVSAADGALLEVRAVTAAAAV